MITAIKGRLSDSIIIGGKVPKFVTEFLSLLTEGESSRRSIERLKSLTILRIAEEIVESMFV